MVNLVVNVLLVNLVAKEKTVLKVEVDVVVEAKVVAQLIGLQAMLVAKQELVVKLVVRYVGKVTVE